MSTSRQYPVPDQMAGVALAGGPRGRDLIEAGYWRRAAVEMAEELLATLKSALVDPTQPDPTIGEIGEAEAMLQRFRRIDGAELREEYSWWCAQQAELTAAMIKAAVVREQLERRVVENFLREAQ